jgi:hypothetical protein
MISKLRDGNEDMVRAVGLKFDLEKVLTTALGIVRNLVGRSAMRFPNCAPPTFASVHEREQRLFGDEGYEEIAASFREARRQAYDVTDYYYLVAFGPFAAHLHLLGFEALFGPVSNCQTTFGLNWEDLDPTPIVLIRMREGAEVEIDRRHREFLERMLGSLRDKGVQAECWERAGMQFFGLRFPHDVFGQGQGVIRICRYLESEDQSLQEEGR